MYSVLEFAKASGILGFANTWAGSVSVTIGVGYCWLSSGLDVVPKALAFHTGSGSKRCITCIGKGSRMREGSATGCTVVGLLFIGEVRLSCGLSSYSRLDCRAGSSVSV